MSTVLKALNTENERSASSEPRVAKLAVPLDVRSASITVLAVIALVVFLHWAKAVFIPITFSLLLSYALTPVVDWLKRNAKLHKAVGAALTITVLLSVLAIGLASLRPEALDILDIVPRATQKLNVALRANAHTPPGVVAKIQTAANEIEKTANSAASPLSATAVARAKPVLDAPVFKLRDYILGGTMELVMGLGQFVVVVALVYFLLIAGDTFRRTLVQISGDTLSKKKITIHILDEIDSQIQRYLLVQIATSALLGLFAWLVFTWIGLDNAMMWGCIGGVLHLVPYAGPSVFVGLIALVAYVQFDTLQPVAIVIASMVGGQTLIGLLLVPWLTQKVGSLNAVTVFVALLAWGWLWGIWGLLLGVPIMMALKAICDRVEDLQPMSAFLGHGAKKPGAQDAQVPRLAT